MTLLEEAPPTEAAPDPAPDPIIGQPESTGVVAVVLDFVGATLPQIDRLLEMLRLNPGGTGRVGSLFQWSRSTQDGVRVTEVWQSHDHFEVFRSEIEPCLDQAGLRQPEITTYEVHSYLTAGPGLDPATDGSRSTDPLGFDTETSV
jgi:hypothetical protein